MASNRNADGTWKNQTMVTGAYFGYGNRKKKEEEEKKKGAAQNQFNSSVNKPQTNASRQPSTIRERIANNHKGETYRNVNGKGTWVKKNEVVTKSYTTYRNNTYSELQKQAQDEARGEYLMRSANDPNFANTKEGRELKRRSETRGDINREADDYGWSYTDVDYFNTIENDKEDAKLTQDVSLNKQKGALTTQIRLAEKNSEDLNAWQKSVDNIKFSSQAQYDASAEIGKSINPLRKGNYDIDEETLKYFDALSYAYPSAAAEGIKLIQKGQKIQNEYSKQFSGYQDAVLKSNQNVANNFSKRASEIDQQIKDIQSGKIQVDDRQGEIEALREKKAGYEAQARDYQKFADFDTSVGVRQLAMSRDADAQAKIEEGKKMDKFLYDKDTFNPYEIGLSFNGLDDKASIRTASITLTQEEKNLYYYTLSIEGEEGALDYLRAIYETTRDENGNIASGTGARFAETFNKVRDAIGEENVGVATVNKVFDYTHTFMAGVNNAVTGIRDAFARIGSDDVHLEGITQKIYQDNIEQGRVNKVAGDVVYNIGNMMPAIAVSVATGGVGSPAVAATLSAATTGIGAFGNTYQQARREGFDSESATLYALVNGVSESALQYALTGVGRMAGGFSIEALGELAQGAVKEAVANPVAKYVLSTIVKQSINSVGEFTEEYLQEILDPVFRNWALGEANEFQPFTQEALYAGMLGALSAGVMNSVDVVGEMVQYNMDGRLHRVAINELIEQGRTFAPTLEVNKTAEYLQNKINNKQQLSNLEIGLLAQQSEDAVKIENELKQRFAGEINWDTLSDEARALLVNPENASYLREEFDLDIPDGLSPQEMRNAIDAIVESNIASQNRTSIDETQNLDDKAKGFFKKLAKLIGKDILFADLDNTNTISQDDIDAEFAGDEFMRAGFASADKIVLNKALIGSEDLVTFVVAHEITHGTEMSAHYNDLVNATIKYFEDNGESWQTKIDEMIAEREAAGRPVSARGAEAEVVANFVATKILADQNTLSKFVHDNSSLARRIMTWIREKITGSNSTEDQQLYDIYRKFRRAFNETDRSIEGKRAAVQHQSEINNEVEDIDLGSEQDAMLRMSKSTTDELNSLKEKYNIKKDKPSNDDLTEGAIIDRGLYTPEGLEKYKKEHGGLLPYYTESGWKKRGYAVKDTGEVFAPRPDDMPMSTALEIEERVANNLRAERLQKQADNIKEIAKIIEDGRADEMDIPDRYRGMSLDEINRQINELENEAYELSDELSDTEPRSVKDYYEEVRQATLDSQNTKERPRFWAPLMRPDGKGNIVIGNTGLYSASQVYEDYTAPSNSAEYSRTDRQNKNKAAEERGKAAVLNQSYENDNMQKLKESILKDGRMTEEQFDKYVAAYGYPPINTRVGWERLGFEVVNEDEVFDETSMWVRRASTDGSGPVWDDVTARLYSRSKVRKRNSSSSQDLYILAKRNDIKSLRSYVREQKSKEIRGRRVLEKTKQFDPKNPNFRDLIHQEQNRKETRKVERAEVRKAFHKLRDGFSRKFVDSLASFEGVDTQIASFIDDDINELQQRIKNIKRGAEKVADPKGEIAKTKKQIASLRSAQKDVRSIYYAANNARNATSAADFTIGLDTSKQGTYQADIAGRKIYRTNSKGERVLCKNLRDIWAPIHEASKKNPEVYTEFMAYLRLLDNADRYPTGHATLPSEKRGKNGKLKPMGVAESNRLANEILEQHPEFADIAEEVWAYNHNNLAYLRDSGDISSEDYERMVASHPHYIPADRDVDIPKGTTKYDTRGSHEAEGQALDLPFIDVDVAMANQTRKYIVTARRNQVMNALASAYEAHGDKIGNFVMGMDQEVPEGVKLISDKSATVEDIEKAFNPDIDDVTNSKNTIVFYRNGKRMNLHVSDGIYEGYTSLWGGMNAVERIAGAPTRALGTFFRNFVTNYNPTFIATNFLKDFGDAVFYSTDPKKFLKNFPKAWKEIVSNGEIWQLYKATGGFNSSFFEIGQNMGKSRNAFQRNFLDRIEKMNLFVEQAPRLAEFITSLENSGVLDSKGRIPSTTTDVMTVGADGVATPGRALDIETLRKAMYAANDITVNFGRSGSVTKVFNRSFVPFLNASVQGFSKITRQFQQNGGKAWARLAFKASVLGVLPAVLNSLLYKDDDDYKYMPDWNKDNNYMFKLPNGKWLAIPRGRFMSFFAGLGNRAVAAFNGDEVDWSGMIDIFETNMAPANVFENNIVAPLFRVLNNETFFGAQIDSDEDLKKPDAERYDESTSFIFKEMGKVLNVSPKRLQVLFEDYTGFIGDVLVPATNTKSDTPLDGFINKFIKDPVYSNTFSSEFREYKDMVQQAVNYEGESDVTTINGYKLKYLNQQSGEISKFYDLSRKAENSNMPDAEKREAARTYRIAVNTAYSTAAYNAELLEKALDKYYDIDEDAPVKVQQRQADFAYAQATKEVFGTRKGLEAAGIDDEQIEKLAENQITGDAYFNYLTELSKLEKYNSVDENGNLQKLTDNDKKQVLLDSKMLTQKDKEKLYKYLFESEKTKKNNTLQFAMNRGVSFNDYVRTGIAFSEIDNSEVEDGDESKSTQMKLWLKDNIKNEKDIATLYEMKIESSDARERNTIKYAVNHGVRATAYIDREIQKATEEGDKSGEVSTNYYYEDGEIYEDYTDKFVSGSKLVKAVHNMLNSGYTDKEIEYFYQKEYGSDDAYVWATQAGMPTKTYLQYREDTALITADKDENGNSINGTKKPKIFAAIDALNASRVEKLILFMRDYKLSDSQYKEVFDYINGLSLSKDEKLQLAEGLGFLVQDGKVYMRKAS